MDESVEEILLNFRLQGYKNLEVKEIAGQRFIYKPLSCSQFELAHKVLEEVGTLDANEMVLKFAVLYPKEEELQNWLDNSTGTGPDLLADRILEYSSLSTKETMFAAYQAAESECSTSVLSAIYIYICKTWPLSPLDLEKLDILELMKLLVQAEYVNEHPLNIPALLGFEEEKVPEVQLPLVRGMETTDPRMSKEFMLDPRNSSPVPKNAFG